MTGICNETDIELCEAMEYRHSLINLCYYVSVKCYYIFSTNSISNMYTIQCTIIL